MDGNLGGREYEHAQEMEYAEDWRHDRTLGSSRMTYGHHNIPVMSQRPTISTIRVSSPSGTIRKIPLIIRKPMSRPTHQIPIVRHVTQPVRMMTRESRINPNVLSDECSSGADNSYTRIIPYANEETVRTSEQNDDGQEEGGSSSHCQDISVHKLEDELEVDVEGVSEGPSMSMPKMIVRNKHIPVFGANDANKGPNTNEVHQLKARLAGIVDANCRFRDEISQLKEEKRELLRQLRKQERTYEKQCMEIAENEAVISDLRRREKEKDRKYERDLAIKEKRRKAVTVMPCLPNRKVVFSKATKQAQSLRLRLLHKYLSELCGPVEPEHRLEEKNNIILRWRKAHAPKPSLEIGRQLLPTEEAEFCEKFGIDEQKKKQMKKWLGQKHIDLFGPSERAIAVRKWRMCQREKKKKNDDGEDIEWKKEEGEGIDEVEEEAGNDTDDDDLMDDIEAVLDEDKRDEDDEMVVHESIVEQLEVEEEEEEHEEQHM